MFIDRIFRFNKMPKFQASVIVTSIYMVIDILQCNIIIMLCRCNYPLRLREHMKASCLDIAQFRIEHCVGYGISIDDELFNIYI